MYETSFVRWLRLASAVRIARRAGWATLAAVALGLGASASAAIFAVTKTTDTADGSCDSDCSLREAVIAANGAAGDDTITLPAGSHSLTLAGAAGVEDEDASVGDLDILTSGGGLTIQGAGSGATSIDALGLSHRHFHVPENFAAVAVSISGVTLLGGSAGAMPVYRTGAILARSRFVTGVALTDVVVRNNTGDAAISSIAPLTITECTIRDNTSGGIALTTNAETSGSSKASTIQRSAIHGNGGIGISSIRAAANKQHSFTLSDSTVSGNNTAITPLSTVGEIFTTASATILSSTIANGAGRGISAIYDFYGTPTVQVRNTIVSGNARGNILGIGQDDAAVLPVSLGNNVIGDAGAGAFAQPTDQISANPMLSALGDHGGPTATHDLAPGSAAIDHGSASCGAADQRGYARPTDGDGDASAVCDVGAVEFVPPACSNGIDDDSDGAIDMGDVGCAAPDDASEKGSRACDDGVDNDGDQLVDLADPGCPVPYAHPENPKCDDGIDNDENGLVDFTDPKCSSSWPYWESCGLGAELVLALPLLAALARRAGRRGRWR